MPDAGFTAGELAAIAAVIDPTRPAAPTLFRQWAHRGHLQVVGHRGRVALYDGPGARRLLLNRGRRHGHTAPTAEPTDLTG